MVALTPRRQALHDLLVKTLVVDSSATPEQVRSREVAAGRLPVTRST